MRQPQGSLDLIGALSRSVLGSFQCLALYGTLRVRFLVARHMHQSSVYHVPFSPREDDAVTTLPATAGSFRVARMRLLQQELLRLRLWPPTTLTPEGSIQAYWGGTCRPK